MRQAVSARPRTIHHLGLVLQPLHSLSTNPPLTCLHPPKSRHLLLPPSSSILRPILPSSPSPPFHSYTIHLLNPSIPPQPCTLPCTPYACTSTPHIPWRLYSYHTPPTSLHPLATLLYPCPHSLTPSPSHLTRLSSLLPSFQAIPSPSTLHPHLHPSHVLSSHLSARHHRPSPRMSCQAVARAQPHFVMRSTTSNEQCSLKPNTSTSPLASLSLPPTHVSDVSLSNTPAGSDVSWLPDK